MLTNWALLGIRNSSRVKAGVSVSFNSLASALLFSKLILDDSSEANDKATNSLPGSNRTRILRIQHQRDMPKVDMFWSEIANRRYKPPSDRVPRSAFRPLAHVIFAGGWLKAALPSECLAGSARSILCSIWFLRGVYLCVIVVMRLGYLLAAHSYTNNPVV